MKRRQVKCSDSHRLDKRLKCKFLTIIFKLWKSRCILTFLIVFQAAVLFAKLPFPVSDVNCCTFQTCPSARQVTLFKSPYRTHTHPSDLSDNPTA